jgi:hypothetical protein
VLVIDTSGNVGIGTTDPQALLHISGTTSPGVMISDTDAGADVKNYEFYAESGKAYIRRLTDAFSGYDPTITFDSGKVGIGTTSPGAKLDVAQAFSGTTIDADHIIRILNNYGTDTAGVLAGITFRVENGVSNSRGFIGLSNNGSSGRADMVFAGVNSSGSATEYMRIKTGGNVGIGTASPNYQLTLAKASGSQSEIMLESGATGLSLGYQDVGSGRGAISNVNNSGTTNNLLSLGFGAITAGVPANPVMTLDQSGKVGIGTTGPVTLLDVLGATADSGIIHVHSATSTNNNRSALMMSSVNVNGTVGNVSIECIHPNNQQSDMVFRTGATTQTDFGTERMRIDTSGKVGIGPTTTMTGLLNVEAADSTWLVLSYSDARAAAKNAALRFIDGSEQFMGQLTYTSDGAANNASTLSLTIGNGSGGSQTVLTALSSGALTLGGSAYTTAGGILQTNGSGVVSSETSIPAGTTIGGFACSRTTVVNVAGDDINSYIDVAHSLATDAPHVTVWTANASYDTIAVATVRTEPTVGSLDSSITLQFGDVQTASDYYVVRLSA